MAEHKYQDISPKQAVQKQQELTSQISIEPLKEKVETVAGADISFDRGSDGVHAAIIVLDINSLEPIARSLVTAPMAFPYIPGLLAFRELPVLLEAWEQLEQMPDVLVMDGHGLAHPRRMGIATHFGIEADQPTIGCAKNILTGSHGELNPKKGSTAKLVDEGEKVGFALRSRTAVNPVYISPGYKLSFGDAYNIMMQVLTKYKLPRTTRLAHRWANKLRKGETSEGYFEY
ncbi:MAG: deoxyribonuclease V [Fodinibius sp.]|nr:deoxyribonuclease V [Fodinibius sp.]